MKVAIMAFALLTLTACSQGVKSMPDRTSSPCNQKPNCVSTEDERQQHHIPPFSLAAGTDIDTIERIALQLPGAKTAIKKHDYLRIECTSKILRFVDDLELRFQGEQLIVRSESRVGYSDFGVNRKRTEQLRQLLQQQGVLQ